MSGQFSFPKHEKLKSRKRIQEIFERGAVAKAYPMRVHFLTHDDPEVSNCQVGFSVSKRNFKRAVDRNRVKRLMREAYRLNKSIIHSKVNEADKCIYAMFIWGGNRRPNYEEVEKCMLKCLRKIIL